MLLIKGELKMTLKREIKDAYIEGGNSIYVKTHSNAVYVDENETETLTQRLDNVKSSIAEHTSQLNNLTNNINSIASNLKKVNYQKILWKNSNYIYNKITKKFFI